MRLNIFREIEKRQRKVRNSNKYKPLFDFLRTCFIVLSVILAVLLVIRLRG